MIFNYDYCYYCQLFTVLRAFTVILSLGASLMGYGIAETEMVSGRSEGAGGRWRGMDIVIVKHVLTGLIGWIMVFWKMNF